jgi:hypothetical protein
MVQLSEFSFASGILYLLYFILDAGKGVNFRMTIHHRAATHDIMGYQTDSQPSKYGFLAAGTPSFMTGIINLSRTARHIWKPLDSPWEDALERTLAMSRTYNFTSLGSEWTLGAPDTKREQSGGL